MIKNTRWTAADMPDQSNRVAIVTGANSGIGYETALALAQKGAHVIVASRSSDKATQAVKRMLETSPQAKLEVMSLDLADLASVRAFAADFMRRFKRLDLLINNAGVMMTPDQKTRDGFELQIGTNHLGHFALTGLLMPQLLATAKSRVVVVSSLAHRMGDIHIDDLNYKNRPYSSSKAYGQSKLANLLFVLELKQRLEQNKADTIVAAAHPGWTATNLQNDFALARWANPLLAQTPPQGALPTLYAATADDVSNGDYYGPDGMFELRGGPTLAKRNAAAQETQMANRLWQLSEQLVDVAFDLGSAAATSTTSNAAYTTTSTSASIA